MSQETIVKQGSFDADIVRQINNMLTELYAGIGGAGALATATAAYPKTTSGAQTLLPASSVARNVIISVQVTQVFADGDGTQPTFTIGYTGSATAYAAAARFTAAAAGATFSFSGLLPANAAVLVTGVAATGTTSTGALAVTVQAVPTGS